MLLTLTEPRGGEFILRNLHYMYTHDPNRSTSVNSVHINGRSLSIVDRRTVTVDGENVLHRVKRVGNSLGGLAGANMSEDVFRGEITGSSLTMNAVSVNSLLRLIPPSESDSLATHII